MKAVPQPDISMLASFPNHRGLLRFVLRVRRHSQTSVNVLDVFDFSEVLEFFAGYSTLALSVGACDSTGDSYLSLGSALP